MIQGVTGVWQFIAGNIPAWPHAVAAAPAAFLFLYYLWGKGASVREGAGAAAKLFSGLFMSINVLYLAIAGQLPLQLERGDRIALGIAAGLGMLFVLNDSTKKTPLSQRVRWLIRKLGYAPELLIAAHPFASAVADFEDCATYFKQGPPEAVLDRARSKFFFHEAGIRVTLTSLQLTPAARETIEQTAQLCREVFQAQQPDIARCKDAFSAFHGALAGIVQLAEAGPAPFRAVKEPGEPEGRQVGPSSVKPETSS